MENGVSIDSYHAWIQWFYENFSIDSMDANPLKWSYNDYKNHYWPEFASIWYLSFEGKGLNIPTDGLIVKGNGGVKFVCRTSETGSRFERELFPDRFRGYSLVERVYNASSLEHPVETVKVYSSGSDDWHRMVVDDMEGSWYHFWPSQHALMSGDVEKAFYMVHPFLDKRTGDEIGIVPDPDSAILGTVG